MKRIAEFIPACRSLDASEFARRYPHHVLVHSSLTGQLRPLDQTRGITIDRLVVGEGEAPQPDASSLADYFTVFVIEGRDPKGTVSVGISSACDIQVNDASNSKVHAHFAMINGAMCVRDNESTSGTHLNGEMIGSDKWYPTDAGDRVTLGMVELVLLSPTEFHAFVRRMFRM